MTGVQTCSLPILTGNTKKVAEVIFEALPGDKIIKPMDEVDSLDAVDLTFIGFPVMQFGVPRAVRKFLSVQCKGKRVALFVTHAMQSSSNDPQQQEMLANELEKCRTACVSSNREGLFHCQGELSAKTAAELMESNIPMLMKFAGMRPSTLGHPNREELEQAQAFAGKIIKS